MHRKGVQNKVVSFILINHPFNLTEKTQAVHIYIYIYSINLIQDTQ
jgi:hypothetical protein